MSNAPSGDWGHPLIFLSYRSRMRADIDADAVRSLLRTAWAHNWRHGVTGTLVLADGFFRQDITGPTAVMLPLATRIFTDHRHCDIEVLAFSGTDRRATEHWTVEGFEAFLPRGLTRRPLPEAGPVGVPAAAPVPLSLRCVEAEPLPLRRPTGS